MTSGSSRTNASTWRSHRANEACQLEVAAAPAAAGNGAANLVITDSSGSETAVPLAADAEPALRVNYATLVSEEGSWVGEGSDHPFDKPREVFMDPTLGHGVLINSQAATESSSFEFQPMEESQLEVGEYNGAQRAGFQSGTNPGLDVGYNGHGCDTENGHFIVKDIDRNGGGEIDRFRALYEDHWRKSGRPGRFRGSERGRACDERTRGCSPRGSRMAYDPGRSSNSTCAHHRRRRR